MPPSETYHQRSCKNRRKSQSNLRRGSSSHNPSLHWTGSARRTRAYILSDLTHHHLDKGTKGTQRSLLSNLFLTPLVNLMALVARLSITRLSFLPFKFNFHFFPVLFSCQQLSFHSPFDFRKRLSHNLTTFTMLE